MSSPSSVRFTDNTADGEEPLVRTSNLPSQLSESTFRTYEPHISRAVRDWPKETQWHPNDMVGLNGQRLSPHTFVARFRDSLVSLKRFAWTTYVDTPKLWSISGQYCCSYAPDGTVWFRARGRRGRPLDMVQEARERMEMVVPEWEAPTQEEVRALCLLIDAKRINGPIVLRTQLPDDMITSLEGEFSVGIVWHEDRKVTVVT